MFKIAARFNVTSTSKVSENSVNWSAKPWKISTAVIVERLPRLTPELNPIEKKMQTLLDQMEIEQSKKCDHEMRLEEDLYVFLLKTIWHFLLKVD